MLLAASVLPLFVLMLDAAKLVYLQDEATVRWHGPPVSEQPVVPDLSAFEALVLDQHRANFALWHREDAARDPEATDAEITEIKHAIDALNQQRNDLVEHLDRELFERAGVQNQLAPLHSETPGLIIDRLSILALKLFHTEEETRRTEATAEHRERNKDRLRVLTEQRSDLADCLLRLWSAVLSGQRRFKLYRQMKMYNDPSLNPVLYRRRTSR